MMNKNTVLGWATFIMIVVGVVLIAMGAFKYSEVAGGTDQNEKHIFKNWRF